MIEVTGLKKFYFRRAGGFCEKPGVIRAVDNVSFSIPRGTTLGLVGESGSGKTTASRALLRLIEPDEGTVTVDGVDIRSLKSGELRSFRKNMQLVFQDPYDSLNPRMTVGRIVAEPLTVHRWGTKSEVSRRAGELLELVGLSSEVADRYPHEFSGGQRQRIGIARAIALNPSFLVLDEPVSALDVSIQGQVLNLLKELQKKLGLTYLFVAHDLAVVEFMSDAIAVMYLGRVVEYGPAADICSDPLHPYTKSLMDSLPDPARGKGNFRSLPGEIPSPENPPSGCYFSPRCPRAMDICRKNYPEPRQAKSRTVSCHLY